MPESLVAEQLPLAGGADAAPPQYLGENLPASH